MTRKYIKTIIVVNDYIFESYIDPITNELFIIKEDLNEFNELIPNFLSGAEELSILNTVNGCTYDIEVYSHDTLRKISDMPNQSNVSKVIRNHLGEIVNGLEAYWNSSDRTRYCISQKNQVVLKEIIGQKQNVMVNELAEVSPQQVLCRIDTLVRKRFNIKKRAELTTIYLMEAIGFILAIDSSSLDNVGFKMRKV